MFTDNKNFYPTPKNLIARMIGKINRNVRTVLEPSAGKGDIIEALKAHYYHAYPDIMACEIDPNLQAVLRDKKINIIDTDFLAYTGPDKFDLIIANPPFDEGAKHLLKAMDIMYRGQIIFLLNAETLRNPFTNERKLLVRRLEEAGASIEYIKSAFVDAERTTEVEVALVNITIDRKVEEDLFAGATDWAADSYETIEDKYDVSNGREVAELVADYNETIRVGTDVILTYFRNYRRIGGFISMLDADQAKYSHYSSGDLTEKMQKALNELLRSVRKSFWRKTLSIDAVRSRLTKKKQSEFEHMLATQSHMDFTESNIYQFITNLVDGWEKTFTDALLDVFDMFTIRHCYHGKLHEKNI